MAEASTGDAADNKAALAQIPHIRPSRKYRKEKPAVVGESAPGDGTGKQRRLPKRQ